MTESTYRAVVASVLIGALILAAIVAFALLPRQAEPRPSATPVTSPHASPSPSPAPTRSPGPAFANPGLVSVGTIQRGASSGTTLVLEFLESGPDAIPDAPGSFRLTLADQAGNGGTVSFVGTPKVVAPGSLGATATLTAPNVLTVDIAASDTFNVELITISGLGIRASPTAAIGPIGAQLGDFAGSLGAGAVNDQLVSLGTIAAAP